jgi:chlorophyll/bacteriochlorophyll a synthase
MHQSVRARAVAPRPALSAVLELLKPITWFAPMWAYLCGVVSVGQSASGRWAEIALGILLAGPLVCGTSQAVNDWYDRHVDAVNEPGRPIPSGRVPGQWGIGIGIAWTALSLAVAAWLGTLALAAAAFGLALAWAYSAPPFRLKQNGWLGCAAVAVCYEGLPWFTGAAIMAGGMPSGAVLISAALYSLGAVGIMALNDFKAIEGDRRMGINSLPVLLGVDRAARFACVIMALPQVIVIGLLLSWGRPWHALIVAALLLVQFRLMVTLVRDPRTHAPWYNATGTSLYVAGMLVTALALGSGG